jgi:hypothetical protein
MFIRLALTFIAIVAPAPNWSVAQAVSKSSQIVKVDMDSGGKVHVFDSVGHDSISPQDKDQVSCSSPKIAEDKRTVGWLAAYPNCCTSYPLPLALVIYRDGKVIRQFQPGQSIWDWQFLKGGAEVAFWIGPTHGDFVPHFELHDVRSGKLLAQWDAHLDQKYPNWVDGLKE